ncbi:MAG TPA: hypothetical protein VH762_05925 [Gemmatimonadaceae bacterium]
MPDDQRLIGVLLVAALLGAPAGAQDTTAADSLQIAAGWDVARYQPYDAVLSFKLTRALRPNEGRIAVIVGRADLSALLELRSGRARLPLRGERIPAGDLDVEAWLVAADGSWRELGRFPLKRLTRSGFETMAMRPRLNVQSAGQLDARLPEGAPPPPRTAVYQDVTAEGGFDGALTREGWNVSWQGNVAGASYAPARLRAGQLGPDAPAMDLASYNVRATRGSFALAAGHVALGSNRLLASQFRSRGVTADVTFAKRVSIAIGSSAGSELVGWHDMLGLSRPTHRVAAATLGIEALPTRPGLLRLELTSLDGSLQPLPAFTQQAATDREQSRGYGAQLVAADASQRMRLTIGMARSRFDNPRDPGLAGDSSIVAVRPETRGARFGEVALDALRGAKIGSVPTSLAIVVRHERTDPLYRSVAAFVQADRQQDGLEANGSAGVIQWQASASRARDNLDEVASLLITRTRNYAVNAALPLGALVSAPNAWWLPALTVGWQGTTQRGDSTPPNSGFRALSQIPDQRTGNIAVGAVWQRSIWSANYRVNRSIVDNRQPERTRADFETLAQAIGVGLTSPRGSIALDLSHEVLDNVELGKSALNNRFGVQGDWRPFVHSTLSGAVSLSLARDDAATQRARNVELRFEASQGFNAWVRPPDGSQARAFIRFGRAGAALRLAGLRQPSVAQWTLDGGLSLRLF